MNGYYQKRLPKLLRSFRQDAELVRKFLVELPTRTFLARSSIRRPRSIKRSFPKYPSSAAVRTS